jgi:hypothetical protein
MMKATDRQTDLAKVEQGEGGAARLKNVRHFKNLAFLGRGARFCLWEQVTTIKSLLTEKSSLT